MSKTYKTGVIGCGDYARIMAAELNNSKRLNIVKSFDPNEEQTKRFVEMVGGAAVQNADDIYGDAEIEVVLLFVPPWVRRTEIEKAAAAGKHIITTKPMAPSLEDADAIIKAVQDADIQCAVFYRRASDPAVDALKKLFESREIGQLSLYKEDWIHHYPQWNDWATDPEKNGGPFLDAMVHNLNSVNYLMGTDATSVCFFSDNHAQHLKCNDTESMKLDYGPGRSAHLFITWAGDLKVHSLDGNQRDHIGICHMVTDRGWFVTTEWADGKQIIKGVKNDQVKTWPVEKPERTAYDEFIVAMESGQPQKHDVTIAWKDCRIMDEAVKHPGEVRMLNLA